MVRDGWTGDKDGVITASSEDVLLRRAKGWVFRVIEMEGESYDVSAVALAWYFSSRRTVGTAKALLAR